MALFKEIELKNGVVTRYHRVVRVDIITNSQNVIEVCSYTSEGKRIGEKDALANGEAFDVFTSTAWHVTPYDQTMTIDSAYEWLKVNVSEYDGAEDV